MQRTVNPCKMGSTPILPAIFYKNMKFFLAVKEKLMYNINIR